MKSKIERYRYKSKLKRDYINRYKINKTYESYSDSLKKYENEQLIIDMALSKVDMSNITKLRVAKQYSDIIKNYNDRINVLKDLCKDLKYDDIKYKFIGYYEVTFSRPINKLLFNILDDLSNENEEVVDRINKDGYDDPNLDIEIDKNSLNKIDIMNGLPNFLMNLGLGKKLYKKFIKDFGYLSSFSGGDTNLDSSMIWKSLASDQELFMFCNDNNIICFWNDINYDTLMIKLREFYYKKGNIIIDKDFLIKYNLSEKDLKKLI